MGRTRVAVLAVGLFAAGGATGASGESQQSPEPAGLVYSRGGDLYATALDGSRTVRLTKSRVTEVDPAASPDGTQIAFARAGYGGFDLWVMDLDASNQRRVTRGGGVSDPAWSPDGLTIYFARVAGADSFGNGCTAIFSIGADGADLRRVTRPGKGKFAPHTHFDPAVSPDGNRIALTEADSCELVGTTSFFLRVYDTTGHRTNDLSRLRRPDPWEPTWSPDGRRIAFATPTSTRSSYPSLPVYIVNRVGSGLRRATPAGFDGRDPAWSRDGNWIAFVGRRSRGSARLSLYIVRVGGKQLRRITPRPLDYEDTPAWLPVMPGG